ncbi:hypothetical protein Golomagni_05520 [Golovinomyces magnicellulatus]|nr:hypothetical protein Golomagni_05520 [Golovinomyces magnicellulatus]
MGVGTTPSALVSHGINTTVVEIDPIVAEYAEEHFSLLQNNPTVVEDATVYASKTAETETRYNYIVHDVFTGGAEPVDLFTYEFLQDLHTMLQPNGVIAINYAGDLSLPGPKAIVNTINKVFPSCRIFREYPTDDDLVAKSGTDFTNMVIFCKKSTEDILFRKAVEADLLRSYARQEFLMPQHEVDVTSFLGDTDAGMLFRNDTSTVTESHRTSAVGHWKIMRTILPPKIWQQW